MPRSARVVPDPPARAKLLVALVAGVVAGVVAALLGAGRVSLLIGWDVLALLFCGWTGVVLSGRGPEETALHAERDDPRTDATDLVLVGAAVASLAAVGVVLFGGDHGSARYLDAALGVVSVGLSWALINTVFTLKYARLYYAEPVGGIDFNEEDPPQYSDFAYLAFTIGMTFQVSDTNISTKQIRRSALRHALLSYPIGVVVIASMINLVSNLAQ